MQIVSHFLDIDECDTLKRIMDVEESKHVTSWDNRLELKWTNEDWASKLWKRWVPLHALPPQLMDEFGGVWEPFSLHSTFTIVRFDEDQEQASKDGHLEWVEWNVRSFSTMVVHLNDMAEHQGGETIFPNQYVTIRPQKGLTVSFVTDDITYGTSEVIWGRKYMLSVPIMYKLVKYTKGIERVELFEYYKKACKDDQDEDWGKFATFAQTLT